MNQQTHESAQTSYDKVTTIENLNITEIYDTYEKKIYNYILRMVKNEQAAEDLTQEVFIKVYQKLASYRGDAAFSTWIYRIATNTYLDHFRSAGHKRTTVTDQLEEDDFSAAKPDEADKVLSIEESLIKTTMNSCIRGYLNNLSEDYRSVIMLHDLQGLKNREISDVLEVSLDTVKIRLHRARKKFRSVLAANCNFYTNQRDGLNCDQK